MFVNKNHNIEHYAVYYGNNKLEEEFTSTSKFHACKQQIKQNINSEKQWVSEINKNPACFVTTLSLGSKISAASSELGGNRLYRQHRKQQSSKNRHSDKLCWYTVDDIQVDRRIFWWLYTGICDIEFYYNDTDLIYNSCILQAIASEITTLWCYTSVFIIIIITSLLVTRHNSNPHCRLKSAPFKGSIPLLYTTETINKLEEEFKYHPKGKDLWGGQLCSRPVQRSNLYRLNADPQSYQRSR